MNGYDELDAWLESGVENGFFEGSDEYFQEGYYDTRNEFFGESIDGFSEAANAMNAHKPSSNRPAAPGARPAQAPVAQLYKMVRSLQLELARMKKAVAASSRLPNQTGLIRKLKELEDSIASMQNSQLIEHLLGFPKLKEIDFTDDTLGTKTVDNASYEFPIFKFLLNSGGKGFDLNNNLPLLLLFSQDSGLSSGLSRGNNNPLLMYFLLSNSFKK